jgi:hypothetical protein
MPGLFVHDGGWWLDSARAGILVNGLFAVPQSRRYAARRPARHKARALRSDGRFAADNCATAPTSVVKTMSAQT